MKRRLRGKIGLGLCFRARVLSRTFTALLVFLTVLKLCLGVFRARIYLILLLVSSSSAGLSTDWLSGQHRLLNRLYRHYDSALFLKLDLLLNQLLPMLSFVDFCPFFVIVVYADVVVILFFL